MIRTIFWAVICLTCFTLLIVLEMNPFYTPILVLSTFVSFVAGAKSWDDYNDELAEEKVPEKPREVFKVSEEETLKQIDRLKHIPIKELERLIDRASTKAYYLKDGMEKEYWLHAKKTMLMAIEQKIIDVFGKLPAEKGEFYYPNENTGPK